MPRFQASTDPPTESDQPVERGRSGLILTLGILSILGLGPFSGIPAWWMGRRDLPRIISGRISPSSAGGTIGGMSLGILGTVGAFIAGMLVFAVMQVAEIRIVEGETGHTTITVERRIGLPFVPDYHVQIDREGYAFANRDALVNDLATFAARAQQFARRPASLGGGGGEFLGLSMASLTDRPVNSNGYYSLSLVAPDSIVLTGVGVEKGRDEHNAVQVTLAVYRDSVRTVVNN